MFSVVDEHFEPHGEYPHFYLSRVEWNDWFDYATLFKLYFARQANDIQTLGFVKIGQAGMMPAPAPEPPSFSRPLVVPNLPARFNRLGPDFFSLGQGADYYENLLQWDDLARASILENLGDVVQNPELYERFESEDVMQRSLLRSMTLDRLNAFRRIIRGDVEPTRFAFAYDLEQQQSLDFRVVPNSVPPTNVHVIIGRNGVGKTRMLGRITVGVVLGKEPVLSLLESNGHTFANFVAVSFSAFDENPRISSRAKTVIGYNYVGLQPDPADERQTPKTLQDLSNEFVESADVCRLNSSKRLLWREALEALSSDPLFADAQISEFANTRFGDDWRSRVTKVFKDLSSGHKIVLLTLTRLVEYVEEKTLVVIDEPEAHLHPPLLAASIRAISGLLASRNGVALIATHSPVVLQEVPRSCVWTLRCSGKVARAVRPELETFGENFGVLTREVFDLEVRESGFNRMLHTAMADPNMQYDDVIGQFRGQLGSEARAIVTSILAARGTFGQ